MSAGLVVEAIDRHLNLALVPRFPGKSCSGGPNVTVARFEWGAELLVIWESFQIGSKILIAAVRQTACAENARVGNPGQVPAKFAESSVV